MDEIEAVAKDHRVISQDIRAAVDAAVVAAAQANHGRVHIGLMREYLPPWATGPQVGARMTVLVRRGALVWDGRSFATNGNRRHRNAAKPVKVYTLVQPISD